MREPRLLRGSATRLHRDARADRWGLSVDAFVEVLERSAAHALGPEASSSAVERHLDALYAADLALACACAEGHEGAWDHFVREYRPVLYRAADAIEPGGGARDLADSLYADLFGLQERDGTRQSLFRYFHGRSSLATWLRAVLSQRYVDRVRYRRRMDPLPDEEPAGREVTDTVTLGRRATHLALVSRLIAAAVARLDPKDRLRLNCYYAQNLTLAQIGRALGEHEATASRHLARARRTIRDLVEGRLRADEHMSAAEIAECFESIVGDPGPLDIGRLLGPPVTPPGGTVEPQGVEPGRKEIGGVRSTKRREGARA